MECPKCGMADSAYYNAEEFPNEPNHCLRCGCNFTAWQQQEIESLRAALDEAVEGLKWWNEQEKKANLKQTYAALIDKLEGK